MKKWLFAMWVMAGSVSVAHADFLGLLPGRSADPGSLPPLSVDFGIVTEGDLQNIGVRGNYRLNDRLTLFANVGLAEFGAADGTSFGGGGYYYLPDQRLVPSLDMALKGYVQIGSLDFVDTFSLQAELHVSGVEPLSANGLSWYAHGGLGFFEAEVDTAFGSASDDSIELILGGGVTLPAGPGSVFAGVELVDEFFFGVGYRLGL